jgi:hypothetical protein
MLNMLRYTREAGFPQGEEYLGYIAATEETIAQVDGQMLWRTPVEDQPIGCEHDQVREILAVWFP